MASRLRFDPVEARIMQPSVELFFVSDSDFDWMLGNAQKQNGFRLPPAGVDEPVVLQAVRKLTRRLHTAGCFSSWMIVRHGEIVGLCGYKCAPADGWVEIGYSTAPQRRGLGVASAAVALMVQRASTDPAIEILIAKTAADNRVSQRVLAKNGFIQTGRMVDEEDGSIISWAKTLRH